MTKKKTIKKTAWAVVEHPDYDLSITRNNPVLYFQKTKPKVVSKCGCEAKVVRATITYQI